MINFNEPVYVEKGIGYITEAILKYRRLNGDGEFANKTLYYLVSGKIRKKGFIYNFVYTCVGNGSIAL